jgi:predicted nucleic acid-binding protein
MIIDDTTLIFFDASCLIAAAGSPSGGSGFLLSLCGRGFLQPAVSQPVLLEAERNIAAKLGPVALETYHRQVVVTPMTIVSLPSKTEQSQYREIVGEKDEHVVAAAIVGEADFLLTLDKKLEERVNAANLPIQAFSPGTFITTILVQHIEYPIDR